MYQNFIGIDIGKAEFYAAQADKKGSSIFENNEQGFEKFLTEFKQTLEGSLVVLETTGGYELNLIHYLQAADYAVHRANTRKVKNFIRSLGQLGKSDSIDAQGLAAYGQERHKILALYVERPEKILLKLVGRRQDLNHMIVQEKNRLKAPDIQGLESSYTIVLEALKQEMLAIESRIETLFSKSLELTEKREILKTIPGIGQTISTAVIAMLPELGHVTRRQIASLGGVAPHPNESGKRQGYRYVRGGRNDVKRTLFMAALTLTRGKSLLSQFYKRLIAAGKKPLVAIVAVMRKILVIANAKIRDYYAGTLKPVATK